MDLAVPARVAAGALAPLVRRLFVSEGLGAGIVDRPVRLSGLISFRGEKRTLEYRDLLKLATELVRRTAASVGPHEAPTADVREELVLGLTASLYHLGDLEMDDVQAVHLGASAFAAELAATRPVLGLSAEAQAYHRSLLEAACAQILQFFSQRQTFVARTLVDQSRALGALDAKTNLLLERTPSRLADDTRFEERYVAHIARVHNELTIYGLDLNHSREWRLDAAYLSLEATHDAGLSMPADRVLDPHDRVLLRGNAGSGKTTLVQWLAVSAARQEYHEHQTYLLGRVPFVLPLRRVMRDGQLPTPDEFLHVVRSSMAAAQPVGWVDRVLSSGRGLLLIDGIDEIPDNDRERSRRWIRELTRDYPGNLWLVTARPSAIREDWLEDDGFVELSLSPMSREDVTGFVRRWHAAAEAEEELADGLVAAIRGNGALGQLAVNPLMCGLLCALHRERRGFLPQSRKDLYEAALSMLLERRDLERGVLQDDALRLSRESQVQLLQRLAHWLIRNDRAEMERADALAQLDRALVYMAHLDVTPERLLRHLLDRSGLLRQPAHDRVDFVHRTFQDYLGAKAAVEEGDFPLLLDHAHRPQREDVVRMAVALGRPAERARVLRGLLDGRPDSVDEASARRYVYSTLLAASCLDQATTVDPEVRQRVVDATSGLVPPRDARDATQLAHHTGPLLLGLLPGPEGLTDTVARSVVVAAAHVGTDAALPVLARYRDHPSLDVRRQLAWSWHRFDTRDYADEIIAHLAEDELYFTAHHIGHLRELHRLGGRERIQFVGEYDPAALVAHISPDRLTHLWLVEDYESDGGDSWLTSFPHLRELALATTPPAYEGATIPKTVRVRRVSRRAGLLSPRWPHTYDGDRPQT